MTIIFSGSPVANVQLSDSFNTWRLTTNKLLADAASLTANNTFAGTISATGNVTANSFIGNGSGLTGVATTMATDSGTNRSLKIPFTGIASGTLTTANVDSTLLYNPSSGTLSATRVSAVNLNFSSDARLKDNIKTIDNAGDVISRLRGVSFDWKDSGDQAFGVIAQELQQVLPQLVNKDDSGNLTVQYIGLIAFLIESNKQLLNRIKALETN